MNDSVPLAETEGMIAYKTLGFTGNEVHKYLGLYFMGAALLSAASPKEFDGPHEIFLTWR